MIHNLGDTTPPAKCLGKAATIVGTDKKDKLRGTNKADVIAGLDGNDTQGPRRQGPFLWR